MFGVMLLLFGTVIFISGTDPKKIKDFINKSDESDKFLKDMKEYKLMVEFYNGARYCYYGKTKKEALAAFKKSFGNFKGFIKKEWTIEQY